jgi:hypothetical protein
MLNEAKASLQKGAFALDEKKLFPLSVFPKHKAQNQSE